MSLGGHHRGAIEHRLDEPLRNYWLDRAAQHLGDTYAGTRISKFPEDLRAYEHLLWQMQANVVIEIGADCGGSALWFRDRLRTMAGYGVIQDYRVITIDIRSAAVHECLEAADPRWSEHIQLVQGDVCDTQLPNRIRERLPPNPRCFVVEDSAHIYATTMAALVGFARFVPRGGFFVVEDGCVDIDQMRLDADWPRGVMPAVRDWLTTTEGGCFRVRRDLEMYGISCHPGGFLGRHAGP